MHSINRWKISFPGQPATLRQQAALLTEAELKQDKHIQELMSADGGSATTGAARWMCGYADLDGLVSWVRDPDSQIRIQREPRYPVWQFVNRRVLPGVREVVAILQSDDQWRIMRYFLTARKALGNLRPLDLLRLGEIDRVLEHARLSREENTW
jgi:hypothetical protein